MNEWNEDRLDQEMDAIAEAVSVPKDLERFAPVRGPSIEKTPQKRQNGENNE